MFWMTGNRKARSCAEVELALAQLLTEYKKKPIARAGENLLGFSRFDELEADRAAFYNTYKAGYNPDGLATLLKRLALQQKEELGKAEYRRHQFFLLFLGTHPPTAQRTLAFSWEANFVKMAARRSVYRNAAFDDMKRRIAAMSMQAAVD
jgi:predicted Zn-dependent protease